MASISELFSKLQSVKHGKTLIFGVFALIFALVSFLILRIGLNTEVAKESRRGNSSSVDAAPAQHESKESSQPLPGGELPETELNDFRQKYGDVTAPHQMSSSKKECDTRFPEHSFKYVFKESWEKTPSKKTEFEVENKTDKPVWVRLLHPTAEFPIIGYIVYPFDKITKRVNVGLYAIDFSHGTKWCNIYTGMIEAKKMGLAEKTPMTEKSSVHFRIMTDTSGKLDAEVLYLPRRKADEDVSDLLVDKTPQPRN